MKLSTIDHVRRPAARAEAWKRYAFRMSDRADHFEALYADAESATLGPCPNCESMRQEIHDLERDAREEARGAYGEGYSRGREDASGGDR